MSPGEVLDCFVGALVDELGRAGVRHVCVCPGSRSTPLALVLARQNRIRLWMQYDERSAAYFALGMAKLAREPVALVCTSGTAAANFLPAIVEARLARIPLVVLTADRPPELRDIGAPQTIDQVRLYGGSVKWFVETSLPEATEEALRYVRTVAGRAVGTALASPAGPVHLNLPFREPLVPVVAPPERPAFARAADLPYARVVAVPRRAESATVDAVARALAATERRLIVHGPAEDPAAAAHVAELARALDCPILADPLSGLRAGRHDLDRVVDVYDALLRDPAFVDAVEPGVVLRFGALPTSKPVLQYLQRYPGARHIVVDGGAGWEDPIGLAADHVWADPADLARQLAALRFADGGPTRSAWTSRWLAAQCAARRAIEATLSEIDERFEGRVFAELAELLPPDATLYAGNSMPVRDLDTFFPKRAAPIAFLSNRGANGIDGVVSSALGASVVAPGRLVLVLGDLSFYHDMNGLLAARLHGLDATIVLLNNDGGGIFSFLPQASLPEHFETLFGTPHGLDFAPAVRMYGGAFARVQSWPDFRSEVAAALARPGLNVIEVPTERARNVVLHRRIWPAVAAAVAEAWGDTPARVDPATAGAPT